MECLIQTLKNYYQKIEDESSLTVIDDVPIESEDIHTFYHVAKQTQFEATAEQGVRLNFVSFIRFLYIFINSLLFYLIIQLMHH